MEQNTQEAITVAEFARRLRRAVESATGRDWVEGEIRSPRSVASGHVYFSLKDEREDACLDCVMYRMQAVRGRRFLVDGARVQIFGRATVWAPRGRLQIVAEAVRPAGRGVLLEALEALKEKLRAEGLFEPSRKRPLPREPKIVGIVTSAHGAAIHDIVTVAFRRGPVHLVLSSALVQGDGAPSSIVLALDRLERYPGLEAVIVGRGGGSGEDLMAFNDERVVRRVAAIRVPVVSAVGHEVDTTLTDWVADVRAATPSEAAELLVPDVSERAAVLRRATIALGRSMRARLREDEHFLDVLRRRLSDPRFLIAEKQQRFDELAMHLERRVERIVRRRRASLDALRGRLEGRHPRAVVLGARAELGPLVARLRAAASRRVEEAATSLGAASSQLDALSPLAVLRRGYAIATRADGRAIRRSTDVAPGESIAVRLSAGSLEATVERAVEDSSS